MNKVILILLFLLSPVVFAKNIHVEEVSRLFNERTDFTKKQNRNLLASALIKNLSELNDIIPRNTPEDESWLKQEMQESRGNTQREINYLSTPIFSKFWLKDRIEWMIADLDKTMLASISLKDETIIWTTIGDELHAESEMINDNFQQLIQKHIINTKRLTEITSMPTSISQAYMYRIWGYDIIWQVVIPSINNLQ